MGTSAKEELVLKPGMQLDIAGKLVVVEECFHCGGVGETRKKTCCIHKKTGWNYYMCHNRVAFEPEMTSICCSCAGNRVRLVQLTVAQL